MDYMRYWLTLLQSEDIGGIIPRLFDIMKDKKMMMALLLVALVAPAQAQVYKDIDTPPKKRLNTLLKDLEKGVKKTSKSVADWLGIDTKADDTLVEIDGVKYMPIYTTNLFAGNATEMEDACKADFAERYANATIISVVIPQEGWTEATLKEKKHITMYTRTAYCYVLAKDGDDGYINARYSFKQLRKPGQKWVAPIENWPKLERADAIPNKHYEQLLSNKS